MTKGTAKAAMLIGPNGKAIVVFPDSQYYKRSYHGTTWQYNGAVYIGGSNYSLWCKFQLGKYYITKAGKFKASRKTFGNQVTFERYNFATRSYNVKPYEWVLSEKLNTYYGEHNVHPDFDLQYKIII